MSYAARLDFPTTNNALEYEALLLGLCKAKALRAKRIVGHFDKSFMTRDPEMVRYLVAV